MTNFHKFLGLIFALAFAFVSGAASGADKQYILAVTDSSATPAPAYTFRFTNDGNSSFNALSLSLPSGWSISSAGGATATRGIVRISAPARNVVSVESINLPTGAGQWMEVTVTGVTGTSSCGNQTGAWAAQPWTGSAVGAGQKFNPKPNSGYPVSTTTPNLCFTITASAGANGNISPSGAVKVVAGASQSFAINPNATYRIASVTVDGNPAPATSPYTFSNVTENHTIAAAFAQNALTITPQTAPAIVGSPFTVSVGYDGPSPSTLSLETTCSSSAVPTQSVTNPETSPVPFSVTLDKAGTCTFKATATNYADKTLTTPLTVYTGLLACGATASSDPNVDVTQDWSYPQGNVLTGGGWSLVRGENKSGATCSAAVPYTFTLDTTGTQSASFVVPSTETQKVGAQYVVVWAPVATSGGWYEARPQVAWMSNGSGPVYMPALPCTQDPTNFASLSQAQLAGLMPAIPNAPPYNGGILASTYGYSQGTNIVRAKMCVSQHGWTAVGPVQSEDENGTKTLVQPWDKIIDLGDGFVSRDF